MLKSKITKAIIIISTLFILGGPIKAKSIEISEGLVSFVESSYERLLERNDYDGASHWIDLLGSLNMSIEEYLTELLLGEEFKNLDISNEDFISKIYYVINGHDADEEGYNFWLNRLNEEIKRIKNIDSSRLNIAKLMVNESKFKERAKDELGGVLVNFKDLNNLAVKEIKSDFDQEKIDYLNELYKSFDAIVDELNEIRNSGVTNNEEFNHRVREIMPILQNRDDKKHSELKYFSTPSKDTIKYALDYTIEFPSSGQRVYISPYVEFEKNSNDPVSLYISIVNKGIWKNVDSASLVIGNREIKLRHTFTEYNEKNSNWYVRNDFEFEPVDTIEFDIFDEIFNSEFGKLKIEAEGIVYLYNLYPKDLVLNHLKFMYSMYLQTVAPTIYKNIY